MTWIAIAALTWIACTIYFGVGIQLKFDDNEYTVEGDFEAASWLMMTLLAPVIVFLIVIDALFNVMDTQQMSKRGLVWPYHVIKFRKKRAEIERKPTRILTRMICAEIQMNPSRIDTKRQVYSSENYDVHYDEYNVTVMKVVIDGKDSKDVFSVEELKLMANAIDDTILFKRASYKNRKEAERQLKATELISSRVTLQQSELDRMLDCRLEPIKQKQLEAR